MLLQGKSQDRKMLLALAVDAKRHREDVIAKTQAVDLDHQAVERGQVLGKPAIISLARTRDEAPGYRDIEMRSTKARGGSRSGRRGGGEGHSR